MFWRAIIVLGVVVLWTMLSLFPRGPIVLPSFGRHLSLPPETVQASSFHDIGYENSWIQFKDEKERLVQVQAIESKIVIVFRTKKRGDLARYRVGWISPVTFLCGGNRTDCDIGSQEKTYVGNAEVQPVIWKTYGANRKLKIKKQ